VNSNHVTSQAATFVAKVIWLGVTRVSLNFEINQFSMGACRYRAGQSNEPFWADCTRMRLPTSIAARESRWNQTARWSLETSGL